MTSGKISPHLTLMTPTTATICGGLQCILMDGAHRDGVTTLPDEFPPCAAVVSQTQRGFAAGFCDAIVHGLRVVLLRRVEYRATGSESNEDVPLAGLYP